MLANILLSLGLAASAAASSRPAYMYMHPMGHNDKCVDIQAANFAAGTPVQVYDCNGTGAQKFRTNYPITFVQPFKQWDWCVTGNFWNGAKVTLQPCPHVVNGPGTLHHAHGAIFDTGPVYEQYRIRFTNYCLDLTDGRLENGNQLQIWECHEKGHPDYNNQLFKVSTEYE